MFSKHDVMVLRALAAQVKEAAARDNSEEKIAFWKRHTALKGERPAVFVHPDNAYFELLPASSLQCEDAYARELEMQMRKVIFHSRYLPDDVPILNTVTVDKVIHNTMWGISPKRIYTDEAAGAYKQVPIIEEPDDWKQLSMPIVSHDAEASRKRFDDVCNAIGDLVTPVLTGFTDCSAHIMNHYCAFRGLDNMLMDLMLEPEMVHEVVDFFANGLISMFRQLEEQNLLSLNNDNSYHYTGGVGYNDELPGTDFDPAHVKLKNLWGAAEAQEFAVVSPSMHEEFILQYERKVLSLFGLNGYGCCDDLGKKLDNVLKIDNLRRVAVCPWADIADFVPVLKDKYIMTWKPQPAFVAFEDFRAAETEIEKELSEGIRKARGGKLELILRDTTTVLREPERFTRWIEIARKAIAENWE